MGFLDALGLVSSAQQVTADAVSTDSIDISAVSPARRIGTGEPIGFGVFITAAGTNTGSLIISSIDSAASNLGSATNLSNLPIATAGLAAGKSYFVDIPPGRPTQQYIGLNYDVTGTVDVTIRACLMPRSFFDEQFKVYADGFTVS